MPAPREARGQGGFPSCCGCSGAAVRLWVADVSLPPSASGAPTAASSPPVLFHPRRKIWEAASTQSLWESQMARGKASVLGKWVGSPCECPRRGAAAP